MLTLSSPSPSGRAGVGLDTNKINTLNALAWELKSTNPDTAIILSSQALAMAEKLPSTTPSTLGQPSTIFIANSLRNLGAFNYLKGNYPQALQYYFKALEINERLKDKNGIAKTLGNIGLVYYNQGDYPKALDYYFKALKMDEELGNKNGIAKHLGNIGIVYAVQAAASTEASAKVELFNKALAHYFKALKMAEELGDKNKIAIQLGNIGLVYDDQAAASTEVSAKVELFNKALDYYFKALKMDEELGDKNGIAIGLGNIGIVYDEQKDYPKALDYYFKALKMNEELGRKNGIAITLGNIGSLYSDQAIKSNIPLTSFDKGELLNKAMEYCNKSLSLAKEIGNKETIKENYQRISKIDSALAVNFFKVSNFGKAAQLWKSSAEHYKLYIIYRDSIDNEETKKKTIQISMTYDFEKKEAATQAEQEKKDAVAAAESKKQQLVLISVISGLVLVVLFALFIFRSLRVTRKQKRVIEVQKTEVEKKNILIAEQKKVVDEKQKDIIDSINYAQRIQRALLASDKLLNENLPEHFILFLPKDIVSGDFYWASELANQQFALVTADSTGHGVPGAIMSMLNISCLNEAVNGQLIVAPNKILNYTRSKIIQHLSNDGSAEGGKDGMDCSVISFDFKNNTLTYAAAYNPIWIVRSNSPFEGGRRGDVELLEFAPDKMPVGKHDKDSVSFVQHAVQLQKGDIVYSFTDGYADQFGGTKGKKFKYKQLEEVLLANHHLPMNEQKNILEKTFDDWKGNLEQVDDVLVIGVRI